MRILYISKHFPPEVGAAQARAYDTVKYLSQLGNDVTVMTGFPNVSGTVPSKYRGRILLKEHIDGVKVIRTFEIMDTKKTAAIRMLSYLSFMFSSIFFGISFKKYDVVYATSPPLFVGISGYVLSRLYRARLVFEVRDMWVDFAQGLGMIKNKWILKIARGLESFLYSKAWLIITVTEGFRKRLIDKGVSELKIKTVTNGTDIQWCKSDVDGHELRSRYLLEGKFIILYAGNIGLAQGLEVVIDAAYHLAFCQDIVVVIVGEGVEKEKLQKRAYELNIKNIIFENQQPREDIVKYYRMCDALLVCLKKFYLSNITIPSKLFDALAVGKPILLGVEGEAREIVEKAEAGVYFDQCDGRELARMIISLFRDPKRCEQIGRNAARYARENFMRKDLVKKLNEYLNEGEF